MKKMLFIFNPSTGSGKLKNRMLEMLCRFSAAGYELSVWPTHRAGDARRIAQRHGKDADVVVCCGGDGTLNEVVDGLMHQGPMPQVGYIPGGTTCDFASSLLLPRNNLMAAVERVIHPKRIFQCDVGTLNSRAFNYVAAFGAFTDVAYKTQQKFKNALGHFAYILEGMQQLPGLQPCNVRLECEHGVFEDKYLLGMVANSASVAGFTFPDEDKVYLDDGKFEVLLVKQPKNLGDLGDISASLLRGTIDSDLLTLLRIREANITFPEAVPFTLDGEYGGQHEAVHVKVHPKALSIRV